MDADISSVRQDFLFVDRDTHPPNLARHSQTPSQQCSSPTSSLSSEPLEQIISWSCTKPPAANSIVRELHVHCVTRGPNGSLSHTPVPITSQVGRTQSWKAMAATPRTRGPTATPGLRTTPLRPQPPPHPLTIPIRAPRRGAR